MFKFSLIVATLGREKDLDNFLNSLTVQTFPKSDFEVIIVDQNIDNLIDPIVLKYQSALNLKHLKSSTKGLSINRNIGKNASRGRYLCVPDDDCIYYSDTLQNAWEEIKKYNAPDMIIGRVFDRNLNNHVFKKTPKESHKVSVFNFYSLTTSISLFFKNNEIYFDENFGVGSKYHSNEDGDLILTFVQQNKKVIYTPAIECNHPPYNVTNTSNEKLYKYGIGFGAMCRKHCSIALNFLFFKVVVFQMIMIFRHSFLLDKKNVERRWFALKGRLKGYLYYKKSF